eukprot:TRINITY_DN16069_c1_g1_i1.p1 TRINITY_DN16069_c1_g1~~TRINITY_DN16069_c1_g1_i1.p1  ORF type:complete len:449 (+),score=102.00 TRINITY_DN16069_c1_g1_i1:66-1412(+)
MSIGEVVFDRSEGYDEDMWDDSELIRRYNRSYEASRELIRRRKERSKKKSDWNLGEFCRIFHAADETDYEGIIVDINARKATIRLHGYNDEVEVPVEDLEVSLGQDAVDQQIADAEAEEVVEDDFDGDLMEGAECRARWSLDSIVYEGTIVSVDKKRKRVKVHFLGYDNEDTVSVSEVYASKGSDWREQQIEDAKYDFTSSTDIEPDINAIIQEHPDVFGQLNGMLTNGTGATGLPDMSGLNLNPSPTSSEHKVKKETTKKTKHSDSKSRVSDDRLSLEREARSAEKEKSKDDTLGSKRNRTKINKEKELTIKEKSKSESKKKAVKEEKARVPPTAGPELDDSVQFAPPFPSSLSFPSGSSFLPGSGDIPATKFGEIPPSGSFEYPQYSSSTFPPLLAPPPPPPLSFPGGLSTAENEALHSMLISWYMAGYHTGFYQANLHAKQKKKK